MTESELAQATIRLAKSEEKFLSTVHLWVGASNALRDYLKENREYFHNHLHAFDSTEELMRSQIEMLREIAAGMEAIVKASAETNATINENSERLKALVTKVESYFGAGEGLEYDN
jgi:ABC-type transporter Mla subunit MlaD